MSGMLSDHSARRWSPTPPGFPAEHCYIGGVTSRKGKSLGILLTRGPEAPEARLAIGLASAAARSGVEVRLFLMSDGAELLAGGADDELAREGVTLSACSRTVLARGLPTDRPGVDYASQHVLARIVAGSDRFVSL